MKNSVLAVMQDFVNNGLPDVMERSDFPMNHSKLRSIGRLSEYPRPLSFVVHRLELGEKKSWEKMFGSICDFEDMEEQQNNLSELARQVNGLAIREAVLSRIFWEAVFKECPRAFDCQGPVIITGDWQIAIPRMQNDPKHQLFDNNSLPSSFFAILCSVLKGGIRWDGELALPAIGEDMRIVGELEKSFARQLYIFRFCLYLFANRLRHDALRGASIEQWFEQTTVDEAFRFKKKLDRIEGQEEILSVLLAEHVKELCPGFSEVSVCEGWNLAAKPSSFLSD